MNGNTAQNGTKYCKYCGKIINEKAVVCPMCGCQVEEFAGTSAAANQPIIINNNNNNSSAAAAAAIGVAVGGKPRNKWVAFLLCFFVGYLGAHKFYEGKILAGILYLCTLGIMGVGVIIDLIAILMKPNPYYV